ncbi:hypothetical protein SAMN03159338_2328 [Sphingomonas sp. NFR04]|uniref:hypothetical protein n=1 Tax=Sphingomonas sp. NFR04 TaxID=1566283 RepID=UPI0008E41A27|nr:hypothetical protein [Sphingomonas sp. NFR04]SFJ78854.1 hypothetical protein SAMN03159338_2328 [Sphingomonas sp. NFR04]
MAKADRLEKLDTRRIELEAEYRAALIEALERTAAGKWGLFDHQKDRHARAAIRPTLDHLAELGEEIDAARDRLGLPPYALQQEFLAARGAVGPSAVGEPKQAQAWLARLAAEEPAAD